MRWRLKRTVRISIVRLAVAVGNSKKNPQSIRPKGDVYSRLCDRDMTAYANKVRQLNEPAFYMEHFAFSELNQFGSKACSLSCSG